MDERDWWERLMPREWVLRVWDQEFEVPKRTELDEDERKAKRRALLEWMARVDVDAVILAELRRRTDAGEAWHGSDERQEASWAAMRERWKDEGDR